MVHGEVAQHTGLNLYLLRVSLPLHLVTSLQLLSVHDVQTLEHIDALLVEIAVEDHRTALLHVKTALGSLNHPLVAIAVTVEMNGFDGADILADDIDDGACLILSFGNECIHAFLEIHQGLSHGSIQGNHRTGAVGLGTYGTELKSVTSEGEGRSAVTVGIVDEQLRNLRNIEFHLLLTCHHEQVVFIRLFNMLQQLTDLLAEE